MFNFIKNTFTSPASSGPAFAITSETFLVDVRTPGEFRSGSVKGAVNIPLDSITKQLGKFAGKSSTVVFCRSGNRSSQAKKILEQNGISNVTDGKTWQNVNNLLNN